MASISGLPQTLPLTSSMAGRWPMPITLSFDVCVGQNIKFTLGMLKFLDIFSDLTKGS